METKPVPGLDRGLWPEGRDPRELWVLLDGVSASRGLLRGLAHDIRNAVQVIALAHPGGGDPGSGAEFAVHVERGIEQLVEVAFALTYLGRAEEEGPASVRLAETVQLLERLERHQRSLPQIPVAIRLPEELPRASAVERDLVHALMSLISNAKEAMARRADGGILIEASAEPDAILVVMEDDGPGFPAGEAERAFEPFYSTKGPESLGLGLTVARYLLERSGGSVRVAAGPGERSGARVEVRLPRF